MIALQQSFAQNPFELGCATSAFQIEGASSSDGKVPSIWDTFCEQTGRIKDGSSGRDACDHLHLYREDVALMAELGFKHYRFSISWPRVMDQNNQPNPAGLDFYKRLLDELAHHNITPNATLFHWDLPEHLQGGWLNRDTAYRFADYAQVIARELGDRLPRVATLNEPWCSAYLGYDRAVFAPGGRDRSDSLVAAHHLMLAHGLAVKAWRAIQPATALGIVLNPELCDAASAQPEDEAAAQMAEIERNDCFFNPLFGRDWPTQLLQQIQEKKSVRQPGDLAICAQALDFIGLNYYTRSVATVPQAAEDVERGYAFVSPDGSAFPLTDIGWEIYPEGLSRLINRLTSKWPLPPIWITENGAADNTGVSDGRCEDNMRCEYLRSHLEQVQQLRQQGHDIRGYYVWSLLDNFEWAHGYTQRFGIVHVDFKTQKRLPKKSALLLQQLMRPAMA